MKYKGKDEIAARRDAKISAVNMLWDLAVEDPISAIEDSGLNYAAQVEVPNYFKHLDPKSKQVLSTGKGCGTCPTKITAKGDFKGLTLWDYLEWGGSPYSVGPDYKGPGCFASFVHGGYLWALQVMENNKASFPKKTIQEMKTRLKNAYEAKCALKMVQHQAVQCPFCKNAMSACSCD
jgi:hypothetical protein